MPTYTYRCVGCHRTGTARRPIAERNDTTLCACGAIVARIPDAPAITFKGTGFYVNDYRKGPKRD